MLRLLFCGLTGLVLLLGVMLFTRQATAELSENDRAEIKAMISDFISENPELIRELLMELAVAEQTRRQHAAFALVKDDEDDPVIGPADATITIYEFSDYNCGYCKRIFADLQSVLADQPDVRLVVKEFPILAQSSVLAAKAAIAAHRQGKFPAFHRGMMTWRGRINAEAVDSVARKADLDVKKLKRDMEDELTLSVLARTQNAATALEIKGTPALVIGDKLIPGAINKSEILNLINEAREAKT